MTQKIKLDEIKQKFIKEHENEIKTNSDYIIIDNIFDKIEQEINKDPNNVNLSQIENKIINEMKGETFYNNNYYNESFDLLGVVKDAIGTVGKTLGGVSGSITKGAGDIVAGAVNGMTGPLIKIVNSLDPPIRTITQSVTSVLGDTIMKCLKNVVNPILKYGGLFLFIIGLLLCLGFFIAFLSCRDKDIESLYKNQINIAINKSNLEAEKVKQECINNNIEYKDNKKKSNNKISSIKNNPNDLEEITTMNGGDDNNAGAVISENIDSYLGDATTINGYRNQKIKLKIPAIICGCCSMFGLGLFLLTQFNIFDKIDNIKINNNAKQPLKGIFEKKEVK